MEELAASVRSAVEDLAAGADSSRGSRGGGGGSSSRGAGGGGGGGERGRAPPAVRAVVLLKTRSDDMSAVQLKVENAGGGAQRDMCRVVGAGGRAWLGAGGLGEGGAEGCVDYGAWRVGTGLACRARAVGLVG